MRLLPLRKENSVKNSLFTLVVSIALLLCGGTNYAASFEDGFEAYGRGDFSTALRIFRNFAEQGDSTAQYILGVMYRDSQGVLQDDKEAVKWFQQSAEQGNPKAQLNLAFMYLTGAGVRQDKVYAHMWWSIAASNGSEVGARNRDRVVKEMTKDQIAKAQRLARECVKENYKDC